MELKHLIIALLSLACVDAHFSSLQKAYDGQLDEFYHNNSSFSKQFSVNTEIKNQDTTNTDFDIQYKTHMRARYHEINKMKHVINSFRRRSSHYRNVMEISKSMQHKLFSWLSFKVQ